MSIKFLLLGGGGYFGFWWGGSADFIFYGSEDFSESLPQNSVIALSTRNSLLLVPRSADFFEAQRPVPLVEKKANSPHLLIPRLCNAGLG